MASKTLFRSIVGRLLPKTDTLNEEGRAAYAFSAEHALAQYAATGCLNSTFYAAGEEQFGPRAGAVPPRSSRNSSPRRPFMPVRRAL